MSKNAWLLLGLASSIGTAIGASADAFPSSWKPYILLVSIGGTAITGFLARSPMNHDDDSEHVNITGR